MSACQRSLATPIPLAVFVSLIACCLSDVSFGDDSSGSVDRKIVPPRQTSWTSFRNGNGQLGIAHCELPGTLELLWKAPAADGVVSAPAIVGDDVYVATLGGELRCIDRMAGKDIWTYTSIEKKDTKTFAPGFQSSPTVTADGVFLGDEDGVYHAVDRATGRKLWTFQTDAEIVSSTSVLGDRLLFGSYDSSLYCLNAKDGSVVWKYTTEDRVNGSPGVCEKYAFVTGCDSRLRAINVETGRQDYEMSLETYLIASPAIRGDMIYVGTYASEVLGINWKTRQIVWRYHDPEREYPYHSSAAVTDDFVVVGSQDKRVHCLHRKSGEQAWVFATRGRVDSSPVVVGDRVFVGSRDGNLYELKLTDGTLIWKFNAAQPITGSPAVGEGCLVFGSEGSDGMIYCFGQR